jgi:lipopolysaccharide transport system ATP-binding protein
VGDRALWLDHGRTREIGDTDMVIAKYLGAMAQKDSAYVTVQKRPVRERSAARYRPPEIVDRIPNIDHRHGDGRAEVMGIAVLDLQGRPVQLLEPLASIVVRISVRAKEEMSQPIVGFMLRNHLGIDFSGTNTARLGFDLPPMLPDDICTVDFYLQLPELYPGAFSFSPAIADGTLVSYRACDWIDNAIALQMGHGAGPIYGYMHLPCRVEVNSRLATLDEVTEKTGG